MGRRAVVCLIGREWTMVLASRRCFLWQWSVSSCGLSCFICTGSASFTPPFEQNRAQTNICICIAFTSHK